MNANTAQDVRDKHWALELAQNHQRRADDYWHRINLLPDGSATNQRLAKRLVAASRAHREAAQSYRDLAVVPHRMDLRDKAALDAKWAADRSNVVKVKGGRP